jgi:hypothetical protein
MPRETDNLLRGEMVELLSVGTSAPWEVVAMPLSKSPEPRTETESLADVVDLFESGELEAAERAASEFLDREPHCEDARKLWKRIRKEAGKSLHVDLPDEERKRIYLDYTKAANEAFFAELERWSENRPPKGALFSTVVKSLSGPLDRSGHRRDTLVRQVANQHNLATFELFLIIDAAKREGWPDSYTRFAPEPESSRGAHPEDQGPARESLRCPHCSARNRAVLWPKGGDIVPCYFQSTASRSDGAFRLPVTCPHCTREWFVVWDQQPDQAQWLFVEHLERACLEFGRMKPKAVAVWRSMICDELVGAHAAFLSLNHENIRTVGRPRDHRVSFGDFESTLTVVPGATDAEAVRRAMGGPYMTFMARFLLRPCAGKCHFVHWLMGLRDSLCFTQLTFFPRRSDMQELTTIIPTDLLTPSERASIGCGP